MKRAKQTKKVGASVVPNAYNFGGPYGFNGNPYDNFPGGFDANPYDNFGGPYGLNPFFPPFPPVPPPIPPYVYDSRLDNCRDRDRDNIGVAASIVPQNVPQGSTQTVVLGSELFSRGGAELEGNTLEGTRRGVYNVDFSVTCKRSNTSNPGIVNFFLSGGFTGASGVIAGGTLETDQEITFTGSANVNMTSRNANISLLVSNLTAGAGVVEITGGRFSIAKD